MAPDWQSREGPFDPLPDPALSEELEAYEDELAVFKEAVGEAYQQSLLKLDTMSASIALTLVPATDANSVQLQRALRLFNETIGNFTKLEDALKLHNVKACHNDITKRRDEVLASQEEAIVERAKEEREGPDLF